MRIYSTPAAQAGGIPRWARGRLGGGRARRRNTACGSYEGVAGAAGKRDSTCRNCIYVRTFSVVRVGRRDRGGEWLIGKTRPKAFTEPGTHKSWQGKVLDMRHRQKRHFKPSSLRYY